MAMTIGYCVQLSSVAAGPAVTGLQGNRYYTQAELDAAVAAERERCARVCDDEARLRTEAGAKHPENSDSRDRCFAAARAAINCAKGVRSGEVV